MTQPAKSQEPSMEEILASIRRIIADDDVAKPATPAAAKAEEAAPSLKSVVAPQPAPEPVAPPKPVDVLKEPEPIAPPPEAAFAEDAGDILDLTEDMRAPEPPPPLVSSSFRTIDGHPDIVFSEPEPMPPELELPPEPEPLMSDPLEEARRTLAESMDRPLMSHSTSAAVDSAFHSLANTVLLQNARTIEDLVKEMLRPMLKSWLDDNLPGLVERLVRAEIERVSRGR